MVFPAHAADRSATLVNLSPYGEWRASPIGLAGRDPIFFAHCRVRRIRSLQKQFAWRTPACIVIGVMGQRQEAIDTPGQDIQNCKSTFGIAPPSGDASRG